MTRVALAGGGLANGLIAWRLRALRPDVELVLLERGATLGGNHTWSFHHGDVSPAQLAWLRPLVSREWPAQQVRFPAHERRLDMPYYSITSARLHQVLTAALGERVRLGCEIAGVQPGHVQLEGGEKIPAELVIDGRGAGNPAGFDLRWQKFLGQEIELAAPHGLELPILMDATVSQIDGYRFVYVLPLSPVRLLVEDTYYSDSPELDAAMLRARIAQYVAGCGWRINSVGREETGVLPIVLDGDVESYWNERQPGAARAGMRAMLFHHTTGYSLPDAVRLAEAIAELPELTTARVHALVRVTALRRWREQGFFRLLNRLMFEAAEPSARYRALEHFYRKPSALIERFYAGRLNTFDKLRVLSGRPPVPLPAALRCLARSLRPRRTLAQGGAA